MVACSGVVDVLDTLEHWLRTASASRRAGLAAIPCWWQAHAKHLTAATFHQRFRIWPSALHRVVRLHLGWPPATLTSKLWQELLGLDCVRDICHALEYMVHGMYSNSQCGRHSGAVQNHTNDLPTSADETMRHMSITTATPLSTLHSWIDSGLKILDSIHGHLVQWPNQSECAIIAGQFTHWADIRGAIGAVDCSHVAILPYESERQDYTNRKAFYSVHLLAIVDASGRFRYVDVGCSGSMADTTILRTSALAQGQTSCLQRNKQPPIPLGYFLLADAGFTLVPWVVMNYTELECKRYASCRKFNGEISKARVIVERAFGQCKRRYKRIGGRSSHDRVPRVCQMVRAVTALHNLTVDAEEQVFGAYRVESDAQPILPLHGVAALQRSGSVPTSASYLGADDKVRATARSVRQIVASAAVQAPVEC